MALTYSTASTLGSKAPDFSKLPGVDGKAHSLSDYKDRKALLVVFMCNHCPYVIAVQDRLNAIARKYQPLGVGVIGINSNDPVKYPDDSFEKMKEHARANGYAFQYAQDESQAVAKAYDAVCTPDPYFYENVGGEFVLRYRGRIDDNWQDASKVTRHELADAIDAVLSARAPASDQKPSMGCSIKWK